MVLSHPVPEVFGCFVVVVSIFGPLNVSQFLNRGSEDSPGKGQSQESYKAPH